MSVQSFWARTKSSVICKKGTISPSFQNTGWYGRLGHLHPLTEYRVVSKCNMIGLQFNQHSFTLPSTCGAFWRRCYRPSIHFVPQHLPLKQVKMRRRKKKRCSQDTHKSYRTPSERYAQCCKATEGEVWVYCQEVSWAPCSFSLDNNCFDNTFQQGRHKRKEEGAEKGQRQIQGKWNCSQLFNNVGHWLGATFLKCR